jgi:hypothetical protein
MVFGGYPLSMSKLTVATDRRSAAKTARGRASAAASARGAQAVAVKTKTLRLSPEFEAGLALLKGVLGVPVNKMVNEAVGEYIRKRSAEVEADLTGVLDQVKAYRRADPHFKQARARLVEAEARGGRRDPVEGVVIDVEPPPAKRRTSKAAGPSQTMIRDLLKAHS